MGRALVKHSRLDGYLQPSDREIDREVDRAILQHRAAKAATEMQRAARNMRLSTFIKASWPIVEPATPLVWGWHLDAMADHLEALLNGTLGKRNLMILVPPGFAKSTVVSVCAPAWRWIQKPAWRSIFASGNPAVATRDSVKCRAVIESKWYRRTFGPPWTLAEGDSLKTRYANTATGFRMALSSAARITGGRADSIFIDDPVDADDAYSESARDRVNDWFDQAFANRLNDLRNGTRCLIMQRLHQEDLAGHILSTAGSEWEVLCIPQEWEEGRRTTTSLGWTDPRTHDGDLAFPERFPRDVVAAERQRLGSSGFAGQHQQRPFDASGEVFKVGGLRLWPESDELPKFSRLVISADTAFKTHEEADYSVAIVLGEFDRGVFVVDVVRGRFAYPLLKKTIEALGVKWRPYALLIEDKASGQSLIQDLQQTTRLPVIPVAVDGDKLTRAHVIVPTWEAGRIYALAGAPFLTELLAELTAFPKRPHDDQVDAFVQGVRHLTGWGHGRGMLEFIRREKERRKGENV